MAGIVKFMIKAGVVVAIVGGAAVLIAGQDRVGALLYQVREGVGEVIDENIEDPAALRHQLQKLEQEYPRRISQVRGDLAQLQEQIQQLVREKVVSERVVALAEQDLQEFTGKLAACQATAAECSARAAGADAATTVAALEARVRTRLNQAQQTALVYAARAEDAARDLGYLQKQAERMEALLAQFETERAQFQAQILQLDRQVDAVARNERLIDLMEKRQETIDQLSRYEVGSLEQLQGRLAEIRARQEAQLQILAETEQQSSYEDRARWEVHMEQANGQLKVQADLPAAMSGAAATWQVTTAF